MCNIHRLPWLYHQNASCLTESGLEVLLTVEWRHPCHINPLALSSISRGSSQKGAETDILSSGSYDSFVSVHIPDGAKARCR